MGRGDYVLYKNTERNFEVGSILQISSDQFRGIL